MATRKADIVGQPIEHVAPQPADPPPTESLLWRKPPEQRQRGHYPSVAPRQARYVMGGQEFLEGGKSLIDPLRERHALGAPTSEGLRSGLVDGHDGFGSCVVPAV